MAEESNSERSILEHMISSRNRDISLFFPFILGVLGSSRRETQDPDEEPQQTRERIVLINPFTQGMIILHSGRSLEDLVREISEMEGGKSGVPPASKASIETMPRVEIGEVGVDCSICLEEFGVGEEVREMPCKHVYHGNCIEKWLEVHGSCPICRYRMPEEVSKKGGRSEGEEREEARRAERDVWVSFSVSRTSNTSDGSDEE